MALRKRTYTFVPIKDLEEGYFRRAMEAQKEREQELLNDNVGQMRTIEEADDYNYLTPVQQGINTLGLNNKFDDLSRHYGWSGIAQKEKEIEQARSKLQVPAQQQPKQTWGKGIGNAVNQAGKYITQPVQQEESFKDQILKILAQGATRTALQVGQNEIQKRAPQHAPYTGQIVNEAGGLIPGWQEQQQGQNNNPYTQWENHPALGYFRQMYRNQFPNSPTDAERLAQRDFVVAMMHGGGGMGGSAQGQGQAQSPFDKEQLAIDKQEREEDLKELRKEKDLMPHYKTAMEQEDKMSGYSRRWYHWHEKGKLRQTLDYIASQEMQNAPNVETAKQIKEAKPSVSKLKSTNEAYLIDKGSTAMYKMDRENAYNQHAMEAQQQGKTPINYALFKNEFDKRANKEAYKLAIQFYYAGTESKKDMASKMKKEDKVNIFNILDRVGLI